MENFMTRANQKAKETRQVENLLNFIFSGDNHGLVVESCDEPKPDTLVHGVRLAETAGAGVASLYVEVTEYHPIACGENFRRSQVDSFWKEELLPAILKARQSKPGLKNIQAEINFKTQKDSQKIQKDSQKFWLPARKHH